MDEPGGEGGGGLKWGLSGEPVYPWAGRTVVVRNNAGHKTVIRSDSSGEVTGVEVKDVSSTGPIALAGESVERVSALAGYRWRDVQHRYRRLDGTSRQGWVVALVAAVALLLVLGVVAELTMHKSPGKPGASAPLASASLVQVLSSSYTASPAASDHHCAPRSLAITWILRGAKFGTPTTVKVTGAGAIEPFNAPVGVDGKTVRVFMSLPTPTKSNVEIIAIDGKSVRPPADNPAGAINLAC